MGRMKDLFIGRLDDATDLGIEHASADARSVMRSADDARFCLRLAGKDHEEWETEYLPGEPLSDEWPNGFRARDLVRYVTGSSRDVTDDERNAYADAYESAYVREYRGALLYFARKLAGAEGSTSTEPHNAV